MRVALVHDYLIQYGGAERVFQALLNLFPKADVFTLVYDEDLIRKMQIKNKIFASPLQKIKFVKKRHRVFLPLMPYFVEQLDLSGYDLVFSDSASYAKGIITDNNAIHICYCHTPTRYLWEPYQNFLKDFPLSRLLNPVFPVFLNYFRSWDFSAAQRPDYFIANSKFVADKIKKFYQREAKVIYPPVSSEQFILKDNVKKEDYYLMVGRLVSYKRFDMVVELFADELCNLKLKIVGDGPELLRLKKLAKGRKNIEFLGLVSDDELVSLYQKAYAFIFPQKEDFGLVQVEAMLCGTPVIGYFAGGAKEVIVDGKNGTFFKEQTKAGLKMAIKRFNNIDFDAKTIRELGKKFDHSHFLNEIKSFLFEIGL